MMFDRIHRVKQQNSQPPQPVFPVDRTSHDRSTVSNASHDLANISFSRPQPHLAPLIQTATETKIVQRVSVRDAIDKFDRLAAQQGADVKREADIKQTRAQKQQVGGGKTEPEAKISQPATEPQVEPQQLTTELTTTATPAKVDNRSTIDLSQQVEANLKVLADGFFAQYHDLKNKGEELNKDEVKAEYNLMMQSAKKFLPDLIRQRLQDNADTVTLLTFDEIAAEYGKVEAQPPQSQVEAESKPNTTGKDRWNKLKKITITDPSVTQIEGKSKSLTHQDIVSQINTLDLDAKVDHESYWLEAWDALHRPAFKLVGGEFKQGHFEDWLHETGMLEWLDTQEQRDRDIMDAFNAQKQQPAGEANFWEWKATSKYANPSSPPASISFWDWLQQKGVDNIKGVTYLESEPERRPREVSINGQWQDAFGDILSTEEEIAIDAPGDGTGWAIFVLSPDGKFYVDTHKEGEYHHSSALAGIPIKGAGAIKVIGGTLQGISDKSGHYKPTAHQMYTTIKQLQKCGVDPGSYQVYTRDLGDLPGNQWLEKYRQTQAVAAFKQVGSHKNTKK